MAASAKEEFDEIFVLVLKQLLDQFPVRVDINPVTIAQEMGVAVIPARVALGANHHPTHEANGFGPLSSQRHFYGVYLETLSWMDAEGFITRKWYTPDRASHGRTSSPGHHATLTAKGLAALDVKLPAADRSVGQKLRELGQEATNEGKRQAIAAIVGAVIGAFVRGAG